jgi:hypothetical protein
MMRIKGIAVAGIALAAAAAAAVPNAPSLAATSVPARAVLPTISVKLTGDKITVGGALRSGGVRIRTTVTHEPQGAPTFIRLDPGVTLGQFVKLLHGPLLTDPNNLDGVGAIVIDAGAPPGTSVVQARLKPGQYVGIDTAGNNPKTWPITTFVIRRSGSPASLPRPAATLATIEFGFRGPGTLRDGELVRFANHGFLVHMIVAARGASLAGAQQIAQLLHAGQDGQAQQLATGFATFAGPLSHGAWQQLTVHAQPGYWVLACFMNTQDGREHTMLGMERIIHITR